MPSAPTAGSCGNALARGSEYSMTEGAGARQSITANAARSRGERVMDGPLGRSADDGTPVMIKRPPPSWCRVRATHRATELVSAALWRRHGTRGLLLVGREDLYESPRTARRPGGGRGVTRGRWALSRATVPHRPIGAVATCGPGAGAPGQRCHSDLRRAARARGRRRPPPVGAPTGAARLPDRAAVRVSRFRAPLPRGARCGACAANDRGRCERTSRGAIARGGAADVAAGGRRSGRLVPQRSHRGAQDLRQRPRRAYPPPSAFLANRAASDERPRRSAGRLLPTGGRSRLARAVPAGLRAARAPELSGRCAKAARLAEQLLVAPWRRVARARPLSARQPL